MAAAEKTIGASKSCSTLDANFPDLTRNTDNYPHDYGSNPPLPFDCGKSLMEFPIQLDGQVYSGGNVADIPDRVLFEYSKGKEMLVKYCGVMRHGPPGGPAFFECPET